MFGLGFLGLAIYVYTIYDVVSSKFAGNNDKLVWVLIVIFLPLIGTILWFLMGRKTASR
ncbi:PLDc N-terminal domain-containing protein [Aquiflexum gelatinilyticum]|uniref:PLDc N-terminal domain-containing protein n=1 Tax=Aquiflexum gelatinilyticum TaxID=2961943 RepID=UPI002168DEE3|nr:PLDc N-terminal domain-containing protein [Aquiflexum gelatinilyticum]MCS4433763.1 PLDc N-terminal domain-containing protein [Aquiflexum gelatinilyticum]